MAELIGKSIRGYTFQKLIGQGAYGVVYQASQSAVDRDVAIKMIAPDYANQAEFMQRFKIEAQLVAQLEHPHILPLYDYWQDEQGAFLVMRYIRGGSLRQRLIKQGGLDLTLAAKLLHQLSGALSIAHENGVIHRDIKPDNILLDERENAYLTDFGIAKTDKQADISRSDAIIGTLKYLAPEQLQGQTASIQSDIYALGLVFYETLTAEHPFMSDGFAALIQRQLYEALPNVCQKRPDLPQAVNSILQKACAKNPLDRYPTAQAFAQDLASLSLTTPPQTIIIRERPAPIVPRTSEQRNRLRMLEKVRSFWIEGVLKNSLHDAVFLELGLRFKGDAVEQPWSMLLQAEQRQEAIPHGTAIHEIYDSLSGELLILGEPGSGKTTTLLQLADELLYRAEADESLPMPVIFNLSSWADKPKPLAKWLMDELNTRYQIPTKLAQTWVESQAILPLLDGLDEVKLESREACVHIINQYREAYGLHGLVVCSRMNDYQLLKQRLKLAGAIMIQPLDRLSVERYLQQFGDDLSAVRAVLADDEKLQRLVTSPLMLNVVLLAYRGMSIDEIPSFETLEGRRRHLFDTYIERMLERRSPSDTYSLEESKHYLTWLAERMSENAQSVFLIERMQADWLDESDTKRYRRQATQAVGLTAGLLSSLSVVVVALVGSFLAGGGLPNFFGFIVFLVATLITFGLPVSLGAAGIFWNRKRQEEGIQTVDLLEWSWSALGQRLPIAFGIGTIFAFVFAFMNVAFGAAFPASLLNGAILFGIPFFSLDLLQHSMRVADIPETSRPNEGIYRSFRNWGQFALTVALGSGIPMGLAFALFMLISNIGSLSVIMQESLIMSMIGLFLTTSLSYALAAATLIGLPFGILFGMLYRGGSTVIEHVVLRRILQQSGDIPQNYADFLDYASEHILLRKVGGSYIFMHRMLLEHFAQREKSKRKHDDSAERLSTEFADALEAGDYQEDDSDELMIGTI